MGRPSKLSPDQWSEIERRLNLGESAAVLSREFGVSQPVISNRFSKVSKEVKKTAEVIAAGQNMLAELPVAQQYQAISLAEKLRNISNHLAGAAEFGAATAHRLSGIAHGKVQEIDDSAPMSDESLRSLKGIAVLTRMANEASEIPLGLLKANKDAVDSLNEPAKKKALSLADFYGKISDESVKPKP